ncbi:hypothetical protein [Paenalcaligenes niemegkensis]|uniref:hypothetical protein n=1 Tax=Paenalcaligenes niemegkensis TaxID=2895469 RepID=UPI0027E292C5|nr:hypothetical protein [Paenalcaligenes niemegkensis]
MSDLQIGLISLGVIVIALVLLFNWWQDRRVRQQMAAQFPETDNDPLMSHVASSTVRKEPTVRIADSLKDSANDAHDEVDAACEAVIDIAFASPVSGQDLAQILHDHLRADAKPLRFLLPLSTVLIAPSWPQVKVIARCSWRYCSPIVRGP